MPALAPDSALGVFALRYVELATQKEQESRDLYEQVLNRGTPTTPAANLAFTNDVEASRRLSRLARVFRTFASLGGTVRIPVLSVYLHQSE